MAARNSDKAPDLGDLTEKWRTVNSLLEYTALVFFRSVLKIHIPSVLGPDLSPVSLYLLASCSLKSAEKQGF